MERVKGMCGEGEDRARVGTITKSWKLGAVWRRDIYSATEVRRLRCWHPGQPFPHHNMADGMVGAVHEREGERPGYQACSL